jgi:hypothetical protein
MLGLNFEKVAAESIRHSQAKAHKQGIKGKRK